MSQEVKTIRQRNLVSKQNITGEAFFMKNRTQNVLEKLLPDAFLKNQNCAHLWINSLKYAKLRAIERH